jgi:hypothetical protein
LALTNFISPDNRFVVEVTSAADSQLPGYDARTHAADLDPGRTEIAPRIPTISGFEISQTEPESLLGELITGFYASAIEK